MSAESGYPRPNLSPKAVGTLCALGGAVLVAGGIYGYFNGTTIEQRSESDSSPPMVIEEGADLGCAVTTDTAEVRDYMIETRWHDGEVVDLRVESVDLELDGDCPPIVSIPRNVLGDQVTFGEVAE